MMSKKAIDVPGATAIGPYSTAVEAGSFVFVSGQLPALEDGSFPATIAEQTRQSLLNLERALHAAGLDMQAVVKTTVFLNDMNDFAAMNEVYAKFFKAPYPARAAFQVACLPKHALVEIEAIAVRV